MTLNGNVTNFQVTNNLVHDNNNIGIDIIGYEGTGPVATTRLVTGWSAGTRSITSAGSGTRVRTAEYDADGLYCDGCAYVTFERNVIMQVDYGIETTSENQSVSGQWHTSGPARSRRRKPCHRHIYPVTACMPRCATIFSIRQIPAATPSAVMRWRPRRAAGAMEGAAATTTSSSTTLCTTTALNQATRTEGTPSGEFQIQYQVGSAQDDYFENNVVYAGWPNIWINSYVPFTQTYPQSLTYTPPPATLNWNLYNSAAGYLEGTSISWGDVSTYTSFADWQTTAGEDAKSVNADPQFVNLGDSPPNLDTIPSSPAVAAGSTSLSCSVGWCDPNGSSPDSIYGSTDFLGNPRTNSSSIDIGAYQNTGNAISNSLTVELASGESTLQSGQSTTLTVTVTAIPAAAERPAVR